MTKICFPHHVRGDFDSLEEAYKFFIGTKGGFTKYILGDIVRYNMRYRNQLRTLEYQALENLLIEDGCPVAKDFEMYSYLHNYLYKQERLCCRNYDIQCYNIKDKITILGHTFNGLEDIAAHCEIVAKEHSMGVTYNVPYEYRVYRDIHVGKFYADYPCFDSFDACDNRSYQNFIFRKEQITCEEMRRTLKAVPHNRDFCMVHESIDYNYMPILYYKGEGDYMLLASWKDMRGEEVNSELHTAIPDENAQKKDSANTYHSDLFEW